MHNRDRLSKLDRPPLASLQKWLLWTAYPPLVLASLLYVPGLNAFLFSMHGGIGWLLLMLCGPYTAFRLSWGAFRSFRMGNGWLVPSVVFFGAYLLVTFIIGETATPMLSKKLGYKYRGRCVWGVMNLPWSIALPGKPCAPLLK